MDLLDITLSLFALIILEIVLGIDNLVFLSILTDKLPKEKQAKARRWGLTFAWVTRLLLLASAVYLVKLTNPLFSILEHAFSIRDLFLFFGGAFLIYKATQEIRAEVEDDKNQFISISAKKIGFKTTVLQVALMDIIFSLDSVLAAIGLTEKYWIMALAITCAILVMIYASAAVSNFINKHPTVKMLALSFLILIGTVLIADGFSVHIQRTYIYFAMLYALGVEGLNLLRKSKKNK
jgi:predicted tellurium resistance membrane protein TerC